MPENGINKKLRKSAALEELEEREGARGTSISFCTFDKNSHSLIKLTTERPKDARRPFAPKGIIIREKLRSSFDGEGFSVELMKPLGKTFLLLDLSSVLLLCLMIIILSIYLSLTSISCLHQ